MRGQLKNAIKYKGAALEKYITPVPTVILDNIVCLGFDPKVECDQRNTTDPPTQR